MSTQTRRSTRTIALVVETTTADDEGHARVVNWAVQNATNANRNLRGGFVTAVATDENGVIVAMTGAGNEMSEETREIIQDLVGPDPAA